jgi:hypothetical protein
MGFDGLVGSWVDGFFLWGDMGWYWDLGWGVHRRLAFLRYYVMIWM